MKCIYKTEKMCSVIITQHSSIFLDKKSSFSHPPFAQLQSIKISDFYIGCTPSVGKPKSEQEILECVHTFTLSWKLVSKK